MSDELARFLLLFAGGWAAGFLAARFPEPWKSWFFDKEPPR